MAMYKYFPRYECTGCRCWPGKKRAVRNINMQRMAQRSDPEERCDRS
jgi:hypothetical protein